MFKKDLSLRGGAIALTTLGPRSAGRDDTSKGDGWSMTTRCERPGQEPEGPWLVEYGAGAGTFTRHTPTASGVHLLPRTGG